jgi:hypothetical protein
VDRAAGAGGGGGAVDHVEERKRIFFKKKEAKNLSLFGVCHRRGTGLQGEKFFASFFQKRSAFLLIDPKMRITRAIDIIGTVSQFTAAHPSLVSNAPDENEPIAIVPNTRKSLNA